MADGALCPYCLGRGDQTTNRGSYDNPEYITELCYHCFGYGITSHVRSNPPLTEEAEKTIQTVIDGIIKTRREQLANKKTK